MNARSFIPFFILIAAILCGKGGPDTPNSKPKPTLNINDITANPFSLGHGAGIRRDDRLHNIKRPRPNINILPEIKTVEQKSIPVFRPFMPFGLLIPQVQLFEQERIRNEAKKAELEKNRLEEEARLEKIKAEAKKIEEERIRIAEQIEKEARIKFEIEQAELEKIRFENEKAENERIRIQREKAKQDEIRFEKEQAEKAEQERIKVEQEKVKQEIIRAEKERAEQERIRAEKEKAEKERIRIEKEINEKKTKNFKDAVSKIDSLIADVKKNIAEVPSRKPETIKKVEDDIEIELNNILEKITEISEEPIDSEPTFDDFNDPSLFNINSVLTPNFFFSGLPRISNDEKEIRIRNPRIKERRVVIMEFMAQKHCVNSHGHEALRRMYTGSLKGF